MSGLGAMSVTGTTEADKGEAEEVDGGAAAAARAGIAVLPRPRGRRQT